MASPLGGESPLEAAFDRKACVQICYMDLVSPKSVFYSQAYLYISGFEISLDTLLEEISLCFYFLKIKSEAEEDFINVYKEFFFLYKDFFFAMMALQDLSSPTWD